MALRRVVQLAQALKEEGIAVRTVNIGGGFGIDYVQGRSYFPIDDLARAIVPTLKSLRARLITEPGRSIVAPAGIIVTRLLYVKQSERKRFYIVDAGMNDLIRPCLYGAYHRIKPVVKTARGKRHLKADVVGPICEPTDFLAKGRAMPTVHPGSLLAIFDTGAYGFSMASNYNYRMRPAEVLVSGSRYALIRQRETYAAESRKEIIPAFLT
jgi:diaminopimelate decarboxylase